MKRDSTIVPNTDYRRFFELTSDMLCTAGFEGRFSEANSAFTETLGYSIDELLAYPYLDLVHPADRAAMEAAVAALATDGIDVVSFENRYRRKDGSYSWLTWSVTPDSDHQRLYCAVRDASVLHEHEAIVDKLLAELERSNTDLAQFAYAASHDLSEPLRMVSSYVQLLATRYQGRLDADADEFISYAVDGANRMKILIDDLLVYAGINGSDMVHRPVDCGALVRAALTNLAHLVDDTDATVVVDDLPTVLGDPGQLAQVFQNLLGNALKFVAPDEAPLIHVSADRLADSWCFSVADNGIGIAVAHRARIFVMFKRLHGRSRYSGTGIGLALCHKIVTRLGGTIRVDGAVGGGSVFSFTIPDPTDGL
jgi:PAS domain S-box-containing protein